jgi:hypothetical protein
MVSKEVGVGARRVRALVARTNSLAQPKVKLCPRQHGRGKTKIGGVF